MKKIISSLAIAAVMTFGFSNISFAQDAAGAEVEQVESVEDESPALEAATEGKSEEVVKEEAPELDFVQTLKQKYIEGDPFWMTPVLICLIIGIIYK